MVRSPGKGKPVVFVSREPTFHAWNGATTAVNNLLGMLCGGGARVTVLITCARSRSPRLFFRMAMALPEDCTLRVPGYLRMGRTFVRPFAALAWLRFAVRGLAELPRYAGVRRMLERMGGERLFAGAWDLTEPTRAEGELLREVLREVRPETVVANYAFWGAELRKLPRREAGGAHRAILMHDLLAEHVRGFRDAGMPLDCNFISPEMEERWLSGADTLIAVQREEAERIRGRVAGEVMVQPIAMPVRSAAGEPEALRCLFVGSNSPPNVQGLRWLLEEVWPLVLGAEPLATLAVVGTVAERVSTVLPGVEMLGRVASLEKEHDRASVCVVPLRVGSGIKIKLLEALAHGKAVVSTAVGVQGMEDWATGVVEVRDDAAEFASAVIALMRDRTLRRNRECGAGALMREHFAPGGEMERVLLRRLLREGAETGFGELEGGWVRA